jgi:hypothetical protein
LAISGSPFDDRKKTAHASEQEGPTSPRGDAHGSTPSLIWIPSIWSSSMKLGLPPKWLDCADVLGAACVAALPSRMDTGKRRPLPALCA